jgi:hypothetical protein
MKFDKMNKKNNLNNLIQMNGGKIFDEISDFPEELIAIHTSGKNKEHLCKTHLIYLNRIKYTYRLFIISKIKI